VNRNQVYQDVVRTINQTLGRKAVSVEQLKSLVNQAKMIRRTKGVMALMSFASQLPYRLFTQQEIDQLQRSPRWSELSGKMIDLMVYEGVITPTEAGMLKRRL
jgi:hypothetical protein